MILPIVLFIFLFVIYFLGVSSSVFGGDSGDIILSSYFAGVAHPPGYPLNTMIGFVFTHLPFSATVAFKANLMSATLVALTVSVLFLILTLKTKNVIVSLAASLTLAFIHLFWLYAHIAEVFQLTLLLVSTSVYLLFLWESKLVKSKKTKIENKLLYFSSLFLGLAIFHHQTVVLIIPAFLFFIAKTNLDLIKKFKTLILLSAFFLLGFLPYIFVPIAASQNPPVNWDNPSDLNGFIRLITRADYGTFTAARNFEGARAPERVAQIISYLYFVKTDFTYVGLFLIIIGATFAFRRERKLFWFLASSIVLSGPFFLFYASFTLIGEFIFSVWERFMLISYFFLSIFLGLGLFALYTFVLSRLKRVKNAHVISVIILLSTLLFPFALFLLNWEKTNLSQYQLGDFLGHDVLTSTDRESIIFLFDDTLVFNTQYIYYTSDELKDRKLILGGSLKHLYYRKQIADQYKELTMPHDFLENKVADSAVFLEDLIKVNQEKFPIYSFTFRPEIEGKTWQPRGLLTKLVDKSLDDDISKSSEEIKDSFNNFSLNPEITSSQYSHFVSDHIKSIYVRGYTSASDFFLSKNEPDKAIPNLEKALALRARQEFVYFGLGQAYLAKNECTLAKNNFLKAHSIDRTNTSTVSQLIKTARDCEKNEEEARKFEQLLNSLRRQKETQFK